MTADAVDKAARISPRKQRQSKPLVDAFFGPRGGGVSRTPAAPTASASTALPSSSPAFATPLHPIRPFVPGTAGAPVAATKAAILPILLPPATLRPLAFRTLTKKHSLTLTSSALQELASFIGRHCGSGWREEGLAERVLEETAKSWKNRNCGFIVDGASRELKEILKTLEGNMSGGRIMVGGARAAATSAASASTSALVGRLTGDSANHATSLGRQDSLLLDTTRASDITNTHLGLRPAMAEPGAAGRPLLAREDSQMSGAALAGVVDDDLDDTEDAGLQDPRQWLKVISAYDQPRMLYNVTKKHFERDASKPSLLPNVSHKTTVFRNRFNVIHQRLLRNELFQSSAVAEARQGTSSSRPQTHKITPVANLLGRHGTHHMLLGMLVGLPTGSLAICDLTASIALDVSNAVAIPADSAWFTPGMIVLVDGVYEEEEEAAGRGLNGATGVGGTIGGRFQAFFVGQPPSETRKAALGISEPDSGPDHTIGGGFGWIDFLGVGSHRAVGARMRRLEQRFLRRQQQQHLQHLQSQLPQLPQLPQRLLASDAVDDEDDDDEADPSQLAPTSEDADLLDGDMADIADAQPPPGRQRVIVLGELHLDEPQTLQALRKVLAVYASEPAGATPVTFVLTGNFAEHAAMARGGGGSSIEYKEGFDALAAALADYPTLLQEATFVFVPGDNDGWVSSFGGGAAVPLPRKAVPDLFTSRVRRAFASANAGRDAVIAGEAVWTTNPSRLSVFGPNHEIVLFRDDLSGRLRRTAVTLGGRADNSTASTTDAMDTNGHTPPPATAAKDLPENVRTARRLVKTLLDQGYLAPFRPPLRPVHWDYASALHLYPLPTALVLVDTTAPPFAITYEGCHVMNPGALLVPGRRGTARWVEYALGRTGTVRECSF